nr:uncharacterized protein LOC127348837 isoform X2 [Lolium perenne]
MAAAKSISVDGGDESGGGFFSGSCPTAPLLIRRITSPSTSGIALLQPERISRPPARSSSPPDPRLVPELIPQCLGKLPVAAAEEEIALIQVLDSKKIIQQICDAKLNMKHI